jgi:hypothetical protein
MDSSVLAAVVAGNTICAVALTFGALAGAHIASRREAAAREADETEAGRTDWRTARIARAEAVGITRAATMTLSGQYAEVGALVRFAQHMDAAFTDGRFPREIGVITSKARGLLLSTDPLELLRRRQDTLEFSDAFAALSGHRPATGEAAFIELEGVDTWGDLQSRLWCQGESGPPVTARFLLDELVWPDDGPHVGAATLEIGFTVDEDYEDEDEDEEDEAEEDEDEDEEAEAEGEGEGDSHDEEGSTVLVRAEHHAEDREPGAEEPAPPAPPARAEDDADGLDGPEESGADHTYTVDITPLLRAWTRVRRDRAFFEARMPFLLRDLMQMDEEVRAILENHDVAALELTMEYTGGQATDVFRVDGDGWATAE